MLTALALIPISIPIIPLLCIKQVAERKVLTGGRDRPLPRFILNFLFASLSLPTLILVIGGLGFGLSGLPLQVGALVQHAEQRAALRLLDRLRHLIIHAPLLPDVVDLVIPIGAFLATLRSVERCCCRILLFQVGDVISTWLPTWPRVAPYHRRDEAHAAFLLLALPSLPTLTGIVHSSLATIISIIITIIAVVVGGYRGCRLLWSLDLLHLQLAVFVRQVEYDVRYTVVGELREDCLGGSFGEGF